MPRIVISEGLLNGVGLFFDLIDAVLDQAALGTPDSETPTQVVFSNASYTVTIEGTGLDFSGPIPTAESLASVRLDFNATGSTNIILDQIDFMLADLLAAHGADNTGDPAALERFLGALDWTIIGNSTADVLTAGTTTGDGVPIRLNGNDSVNLEFGLNDFFAAAGDDTVIGGQQAETLNGGADDDRLVGRGGDDLLIGGTGNDTILGGVARDRLVGGSGDDSLDGGSQDDILIGGTGADRALGGDGDDRVIGASGDDDLFGDAGEDTLLGGADDDFLRGGDDNDVLIGGTGDDILLGQLGNDLLIGGAGNDTLFGDAGDDRMLGGTGADLFIFADGEGADRIIDFVPGEDTILLSGTDSASNLIDISYNANGVRVSIDGGDTLFVAGVTQTGPGAFTGFDQTDDGIILF